MMKEIEFEHRKPPTETRPFIMTSSTSIIPECTRNGFKSLSHLKYSGVSNE
jgi:hypothetical protein